MKHPLKPSAFGTVFNSPVKEVMREARITAREDIRTTHETALASLVRVRTTYEMAFASLIRAPRRGHTYA
jgi:hypothetical protein